MTDHSTKAPVSMATTDIQQQILDELKWMNDLNRKLVSQPPLKSKALWNFLLQFFGLLAAFTFGIFAILAWRAAEQANTIADLATDLASSANVLASSANALASDGNGLASTAGVDASAANVLAILAYCDAAPTSSGDICGSIRSQAASTFQSYASVYLSITDTMSGSRPTTPGDAGPTSTDVQATPTDGSGPADSGASASPADIGVIAGATVGGIAGLVLLCGAAYLPYMTYKAKMRRAESLQMNKEGI